MFLFLLENPKCPWIDRCTRKLLKFRAVLPLGVGGWNGRSMEEEHMGASRCFLLFYLLHWVKNTGTPCFIALLRYCIFYKLKFCGHPASTKSISTIFSAAFAHFKSLRHILVIFTIFQTFLLLLYLLCWAVISDLWCYHC